MYRIIGIVGSLLGAAAVIGGALGAHLWRQTLTPALYESYSTAIAYLLPHAVLLVALSARGTRRSGFYLVALVVMLLGTVLFSGGLIAWALSGQAGWRQLAPLGGSLLIGAWLLLALAVARAEAVESP